MTRSKIKVNVAHLKLKIRSVSFLYKEVYKLRLNFNLLGFKNSCFLQLTYITIIMIIIRFHWHDLCCQISFEHFWLELQIEEPIVELKPAPQVEAAPEPTEVDFTHSSTLLTLQLKRSLRNRWTHQSTRLILLQYQTYRCRISWLIIHWKMAIPPHLTVPPMWTVADAIRFHLLMHIYTTMYTLLWPCRLPLLWRVSFDFNNK